MSYVPIARSRLLLLFIGLRQKPLFPLEFVLQCSDLFFIGSQSLNFCVCAAFLQLHIYEQVLRASNKFQQKPSICRLRIPVRNMFNINLLAKSCLAIDMICLEFPMLEIRLKFQFGSPRGSLYIAST
jgi:hypothetical protein